MPGSSLKNALHRRNHKERGQLVNRSRLGLLEKKKDYVQRAKDYHSKQDRIHRLQEKAAMRNKDEFYFSMIKSRTKEGVHVQDRGNVPIPFDTVKLLKSQDENYIRTMRAAGLKRIEALKAKLSAMINLLGDTEVDSDESQLLREAGLLPPSNSTQKPRTKKRKSVNDPSLSNARPSHVVFVDSIQDAKSYVSQRNSKQDTSNSFVSPSEVEFGLEDVDELDLGWVTQRVNTAGLKKKRKTQDRQHTHAQLEVKGLDKDEAAKAHRSLLLKELSARLERDSSLRDALLEIRNQRLRMQNGSKKLVQGKSDSEKASNDESKGFTFNMNGSDDEDEVGARRRSGTDGGGPWKPQVYKWKFERGN